MRGPRVDDVYRDPTDDCARYTQGIIFGITLLASIGLLCGTSTVLFHLDTLGSQMVPLTSPGWVAAILWVWFGIGVLLLGLSSWYFYKEIPHWSAKGMTADRFLAGIIVFGIALVWAMADLFVHSHAHTSFQVTFTFFGVVAGLALCFGGFVVGLFYAFAEWFSERPRTLASVRVERRYGLDVNLVPHEDYCTPHMDGMEAIVICQDAGRYTIAP